MANAHKAAQYLPGWVQRLGKLERAGVRRSQKGRLGTVDADAGDVRSTSRRKSGHVSRVLLKSDDRPPNPGDGRTHTNGSEGIIT
jgi:hypothetical protein